MLDPNTDVENDEYLIDICEMDPEDYEDINEKKTMVQSLVEQGKLEEARTAKEELKNMQEQFDLLPYCRGL